MGYFLGVFYFYLWYTSILAGYLCFYCPILPLVMFSNKLYRYYTDTILTFWQQYPTVLVQLLCNTKIQVTGDSIKSNEMSILVMNHRTRTDWNYLWPSLYHSIEGMHRFKHSTKFLLKDVIKHAPGPGWVMQLTLWIFIKRLWIMDKKNLEKFCDYVSALSYKFSLLVFPEGTDFTEDTKRKSDNFARINNLQEYNYLLHPRTTGFTFLSSQLLKQKCLDAIYDLTIIYPDIIPQTEKHLLRGNFPKEVKLHIRRYPSSVLPRSEDGLKTFLEEVWKKKETVLKNYYETENFPEGQTLKRSSLGLIPALIFWTILPYITIYLLIYYNTFRRICILHTMFLICTSFLSGGFQWFEISLYDIKKEILGGIFAF
ncbi:hypothetical protein WA026_019942 [Henosepilachna vigintioctopunctata]|uniref:Phospholipid/glycerol acyltransferase domain-containing protein n=1 Tax=Henosepilachna vigintioctopunctata TaxID=420089 RepID=A0AAW1V4A9_9CUCU